ncbi:MAG: hypothetical protein ACRCX2_37560 [Paraclostridium sp.]
MKKIKLIKIKTQALRGLTIQIEPCLYDRLNKISYDLKVSKKILINTGLEKLLDDIEILGVEV